VTVTITGLADLNDVLRAIAPREGINLIRATAQDIASQLAKSAKEKAPDDPSTGAPDLKSGIKAKRDKSTRDKVSSSVRVYGAFYWRYLEYGQGPDGVEHAFFLKALQEMRPDMDRVYLEAFGKKLAARLARERKRRGL
jgi:HK97 gp10 family phage protein